MLLAKNTLFEPLVAWVTGCRAVSPGQRPFCASASISVPGAPASSLVTGSQVDVLNPGVEICAPDCVAMALLCTVQPPAPRLATSVAPVSAGEASAWPLTGAWLLAALPALLPVVLPAARALEPATSDAAPTSAVIQNVEVRRTTALPIAGDLSATRHDR